MTEPRKRSLPKLNLLTDVSLLPSLEASPIHSPWSERSKDFEAVMSATKLVAVNADQVWDLAYSDCNYIQRDLQELDKGMALFMESDFNAAETFFGTHQKATINTSYGYATIMFFKAFMSFDKKEIEAAFCAIEECLQICTVLRKKGSPLSTIWSAGGANACNTFKEMTLIEKHAELTHASAMFMKSVLSTLHNMTIGTIIREGLRLRANYQTFKAAFKYLEELYTEEGKAGFERQGIDAHLIAAVLFAVGGYNVIFSLVPAAYLKLFKIVGLHGDRQFGISCLETAASWKKVDYSIVYGESNGQKSSTVPFDMPARTLSLPSIHSFCADWALFTIHTALSPIITIPETDLKCVSIHLEMRLKAFPNSLMYSMFQGKYLKTMGDSTAAEKQLVQNIKDQKDWPTFVVGGMWCLGFLRASQGKLEQAAGCFEILYRDANICPAVYAYMEAALLYQADRKKYEKVMFNAMKIIPSLCKKIAGQTPPMEAFVANKARRFLKYGHLTLPAYEFMYRFWTGFQVTARNDIPVIVEAIDTEIQWLEGRQNCSPLETPYKTFWDDMALAKLLKGLALLQYASPFRESIAPPMELVHNTLNPQTKKRLLIAADEIASIIPMADKITKDGYILSFGRYELAQTYIRLGDYHRAQAELRAASKGGTLSHENVSPKKQFCNNIGSLLGVRIENMQLKLNTLLKLSQWKEERNEDIWAAYEDLD